jgi:hypothetical protein
MQSLTPIVVTSKLLFEAPECAGARVVQITEVNHLQLVYLTKHSD